MKLPNTWEEKIKDNDFYLETGVFVSGLGEDSVDIDDLIAFIKQVESQARLSEREELRKKIITELDPPEKWESCLKVAYGSAEMCMMCGFVPEKLKRTLLSLLSDNK